MREGVVAGFGVAGKSNEGSNGEAQREEDLCGSLQPHLWTEESVPLRERERGRGWGRGGGGGEGTIITRDTLKGNRSN